MKYEKDFQKVSFGFGTEKVAGSGSLDRAQDAPDNVRTKYDKTQIAKNVGKAALLSAAVIFKHKVASKRRSK